jgi:hypothetical protein
MFLVEGYDHTYQEPCQASQTALGVSYQHWLGLLLNIFCTAHGQAYSPYYIAEDGSETDKVFPLSFMQADTSLWNLGFVPHEQSDWGRIKAVSFDTDKIRRGLLHQSM